MVIDTSAFLAILQDEPERASFTKVIEAAPVRRTSAATAEAAPELKRMAGGSAVGRKLEKPVCHYSLNWAPDETPDRREMSRARARRAARRGFEPDEALRELSPPRSVGNQRGGRPVAAELEDLEPDPKS